MKTSDSYLDLLFQNRNKAYGAYELRRNYESRLLKAFGMALLVAALAFLIPYVLTLLLTKPKPIADIPSTPYIIQPPFQFEKEEVYTVKPAAARQIIEGAYRVVKRDEIIPKTEAKPVDNPTTTTTTTDPGIPPENPGGGNTGGTLKEIVETPVEVMNTASVDVAPSFPGGEKEMMKFLERNLHYSAFARENGISGKVYVSFITNEAGEITEAQIKRSLDPSLDAEVLRVVNKMPKWTPGIYHGKPVKVIFMLPVTFALR